MNRFSRGARRRRLHTDSRRQYLRGEPPERRQPPAGGMRRRLFLIGEVPWDEASRYGICDTNKYSGIAEVVKKPEDPPSNLMMTEFYMFTPAIFHACHLVQPRTATSTRPATRSTSCCTPNGRLTRSAWTGGAAISAISGPAIKPRNACKARLTRRWLPRRSKSMESRETSQWIGNSATPV